MLKAVQFPNPFDVSGNGSMVDSAGGTTRLAYVGDRIVTPINRLFKRDAGIPEKTETILRALVGRSNHLINQPRLTFGYRDRALTIEENWPVVCFSESLIRLLPTAIIHSRQDRVAKAWSRHSLP